MHIKYTPVPIRHGNRKNSRLRGVVKAIGVSMSVVMLAAVMVGGSYVLLLQEKIADNAVALDTAPPSPQTVSDANGTVQTKVQITDFDGGATILIVGSDSGESNPLYGERGGALNDVNILLHIAADHSTATAISIPRDTFVNIPECSDPDTGNVYAATSNKINAALSRGGLNCVVQTVENLTGSQIPYAAMVEFDGVINLSNAVGGVPVCLSNPIEDDYAGAHFPAGENILAGDDALAFLRTRHGVADGSDLGRISNQQVFLSSLVRVAKSDATLSDPTKLFSIAGVVANNMKLSTSLTDINTIVSLASTLKKIPVGEINFIQFPTSYTGIPGVQSLVPNQDALNVLMDSVLNDRLISLTGKTGPGDIGSYVEGDMPPEVSPDPNTQAKEVAVLPDAITGQKASQVTCSRTFGDY